MGILSRTVTIPLADYPNGTRSFTVNSVSDAATAFAVELARCTSADPTIWPDAATEVRIEVAVSTDNGKTYVPQAAVGIVGGIWVLKDGTESTRTRLNVPLPAGTRRRLRITATVAGGPLRTQGTVELRN